MPSIRTKQIMHAHLFSKMVLIAACSSLVACGGSSGSTTRKPSDPPPVSPVEKPIEMLFHMPMHIENAKVEVYILGEKQPFYTEDNYTGFGEKLVLPNGVSTSHILWAKITGTPETRMYDPIYDRYVPFDGELNALTQVGNNRVAAFSPQSEAIFQRALIRAGNLELKDADVKLILTKHLTKASTDVQSSLNQAFNSGLTTPKFSNEHSISLLYYDGKGNSSYINTFTGLGLLSLWAQKNPDSKNTYLDLAKNLAVDLRDGYLDGRTIQGDLTPFIALVDAPKNVDPAKNNHTDVGALQRETREGFGIQLKQATLAYADRTFQSIRNPAGYKALQENAYFPPTIGNSQSNRLRWSGAGDYRSALGFTTDTPCETGSLPCKTGLNADDIGANYSDVEYLVGTHEVGSCTIKIYPSGDVQLDSPKKVYIGQINRDITDSLMRVNTDTHEYLLNVGTGEIRPPYFIQLEIIAGEIKDARTGFSRTLYPLKLDEPNDPEELDSCQL